MNINLIAVIFVITAFLTLLAGTKLLARRTWISGFIRGVFGIFLLATAVAIGLAAYDINSYKSMAKDRAIATLSFTELELQKYEATFVNTQTGKTEKFEISGDQWQIDARILRWGGPFLATGAKPSFRLERISGRYLSIEDEHSKKRTVHSLSESEGLDFWSWANKYDRIFSFVQAVYGNAVYLPMEDGALYEVAIGHTGLTGRPLNQIAEEAISIWQ